MGRVRKGPGDPHKAKMKMGATNWWGQKDERVCAGEKGERLAECKVRWGRFEPAYCKRTC